MRYLSPQAVDNLKLYKYSAEDRSFLVKIFFRFFWDAIVWCFPRWVAPNLITSMGFIVILVNFFTMVYYSPNLDQECPPWVYLSFAAGIFLYQTLDNIDGRQARRTGSSSALGELFDHGCDSLFVTVSAVTLYVAMQLPPWKCFIFLLLGLFPFYFAHWEEWHTHHLILGVFGNPTEAQIGMCLVHIYTWWKGKWWWWQMSPAFANKYFSPLVGGFRFDWFFDIYAHVFIMWCFGLLVGWGMLDNVLVVERVRKKEGRSFASCYALLLPLASHVGFCALWYYVSPSSVLENCTLVSLCFLGLNCSYTLDRMMLNRITKVPFRVANPLYLLPAVGCLQALLVRDPTVDRWCLYGLFAALLLLYIHMVVFVIREMCDALNIYCFKITPKDPAKGKGQ